MFEFAEPLNAIEGIADDDFFGLSRVCRTRQRIAASVIPERRSLILDRNVLKRGPFYDPGSRFAWPG